MRVTGDAVVAQLVLGALDEQTAFVEFEVDCDADLILGYDWLRAHDLAFLYDSDEVCLCAERGCTSDRSVRLDLTLDVSASPATRLSPAEARALLGAVGLGEVPTLGSGAPLSPVRPPSPRSRWPPPLPGLRTPSRASRTLALQ